ncbi:unnamed protein product [Euphydryas editha]|uniref:GATA zinc finger domain-containing protein 14-like n=1 Tax=Euphydryas editha TaxID=104508 RepID=A0AAU9TZB8_EUPED|nr:unnamed protein product [Euphydryas editha]
MGTKLLIFLLAISICNGHIPLLGDIISATRTNIHKVAGTILDGITHGHRSTDVETSHQSNYERTKAPEETIVIVVENGANSNEYNRPSENYGPKQHDHRPSFNNNGGYGPGYNEYRPNHNRPVTSHHHENENFNNYNNFHQGHHYGHPQNNYDYSQYHGHNPNRYSNYPNQRYPNYENHQYPQQQNGNNGFYDQNNGNNNNGYNPRPNPNNNGIPIQPPPFNHNNQQNNNNFYPKPNYNNNNVNSDDSHFIKNPTTEFLTEGSASTVKPTQMTKTPNNDGPLFIPLLPDGSKDITAPKRETGDHKEKPAKDQEEDFELDVRIKE